MKFPFFKPDQKPAQPTAGTTPPSVRPLQPAGARPATAAPATSGIPGKTISFTVGAIVHQLPPSLTGKAGQLATATIVIPIDRVLPQLGSGKVTITLGELLKMLPADLLPSPLPVVSQTQMILLPLPQLIASIPPDLLMVKNQTVQSLDVPGLDHLPQFFDEPKPVVATAASFESAAPAPQPTGPTISLKLSIILSVLPDEVLACTRSELSHLANLSTPVNLPLQPVLEQLQTGAARLPLSLVVRAVPQIILVKPLPSLEGKTVTLPLEAIVPQISPQQFAAIMGRGTTTLGADLESSDIPMPFMEKAKPAPIPAPAPAPVSPPAPEPEPEPVGIDMGALEDESFSIFAEKTAPAPVAKAQPVTPVPVPEIKPPAPPAPKPETVIAAAPAPVLPAPEPVKPLAPVVVPVPEPIKPVVPPVVRVVEPVAEVTTPAEAKHFLVDLNECMPDDLLSFEGIGPSLAKRIVEYRQAHGPFRSMEDVRAIPGVGRKTFRALTGPKSRPLNKLLGVAEDKELTLQEIMRLTGTMRGVAGCLLAGADGVFVTGTLPPHLDQNTISVFAPQLFKKVGRYTRELRVGQVKRMTLFTDQQPVSIFEAGDVYLIIIHDTRHFSKTLLRRCERVGMEIARLCRQRAVV